MQTLGLYIKRDGQKKWGCMATAKFETSEEEAREKLMKQKAGWFHNGPPEYASAAWQIAPYSPYGEGWPQ